MNAFLYLSKGDLQLTLEIFFNHLFLQSDSFFYLSDFDIIAR